MPTGGISGSPLTLTGTATVTETDVPLTTPVRKGINDGGVYGDGGLIVSTVPARTSWAKKLQFVNRGANDILVRLNGQATQRRVLAGASWNLDSYVNKVSVQAAAATSAYDIDLVMAA